MRFALRNKSRLKQAYGETFCNELVSLLKKYFANNQDIPCSRKEGYAHEFVSVPGSGCTYQFAIVNKQYDVLTLAYFPYSGSN